MQGFTIVDHDCILDNDNLNIQEQSVLIAIISYSGKGFANPSYKGLKLRSKISDDRTLIKAIASLKEKGYVEVTTSKGKKNIYKPTVKLQYQQNYSNCNTTGTPTGELQEPPTVDLQYKKQNIKEKENIYSHSENDKAEDKYLEIFNHWNTEGVTKASKLVADIRKGIDNAIKQNLTLDDIKQSICAYAKAYKQGAYKNQWRLVDFLNKKDRDTGKQLLLLFLNNSTNSSKNDASIVVEAAKEIKKSKASAIPYQEIFNLYVEQGIVKHNTLTDSMKNAIKKAAAKFTVDEIKIAIERYGQMYRDKENQYAAQYCKYKWTLNDLLTREKGMSEFLDEGGKWIRYKDKTESKKQEVQQKGLEDFF